ncbi:MAG: helix-turn-helix domain-containing protein [Wenzhouxiangella sp.]|nr:helix-turn-helix domain-containing protein [Wenzhouxiangella sp.]
MNPCPDRVNIPPAALHPAYIYRSGQILLGFNSSTSIVPISKMHEPLLSSRPIRSAADLGAAIRSARKALGLTLEQLSGLSGLGVRFLSELERGKATAQLGKALEVAKLLGISVLAESRADSEP